jgi:hypothetical protein
MTIRENAIDPEVHPRFAFPAMFLSRWRRCDAGSSHCFFSGFDASKLSHRRFNQSG